MHDRGRRGEEKWRRSNRQIPLQFMIAKLHEETLEKKKDRVTVTRREDKTKGENYSGRKMIT